MNSILKGRSAEATPVRSLQYLGTAKSNFFSRPDNDGPVSERGESSAVDDSHERFSAADYEALTAEAYTRGFAAGVEEGRLQVAVDDERLADEVRRGLVTAQRALEEHLADSGLLVRRLMHIVLEKMLGGDSDRASIMETIVVQEINRIDPSELIQIRLASIDFVDPDGLRDRLKEFGLPDVALIFDSRAPSGHCEFKLTMGRVDASIERQLATIGKTLDETLGHAE
jgi:flagellar biosynthesis/type III secretory pathway protein FliH